MMAATKQTPKYNVNAKVRDGNAYAIMGAVTQALRKAGASEEERKQYTDEATSGDYDNLLCVSMRWVNIVLD